VKKGRHRRYEEARELKRTSDGFDDFLGPRDEPCVECEGLPGEHKSWCALADSSADKGDQLFPS